MFKRTFKYKFQRDRVIFESRKKSYEFLFDEIRKIRILSIIGVCRNQSGIWIYGKQKKIIKIGFIAVDDYNSFVKILHASLVGQRVKYIKGHSVARWMMLITLPIWLSLAYLIIQEQIFCYRSEGGFDYSYLYVIVLTVRVLFNYKKNFQDLKVEIYNPEIIIRFGPRIIFDPSYRNEILQNEEL